MHLQRTITTVFFSAVQSLSQTFFLLLFFCCDHLDWLTTSKFQRTGVCIHREILQVHGALGMNSQPEAGAERETKGETSLVRLQFGGGGCYECIVTYVTRNKKEREHFQYLPLSLHVRLLLGYQIRSFKNHGVCVWGEKLEGEQTSQHLLPPTATSGNECLTDWQQTHNLQRAPEFISWAIKMRSGGKKEKSKEKEKWCISSHSYVINGDHVLVRFAEFNRNTYQSNWSHVIIMWL